MSISMYVYTLYMYLHDINVNMSWIPLSDVSPMSLRWPLYAILYTILPCISDVHTCVHTCT